MTGCDHGVESDARGRCRECARLDTERRRMDPKYRERERAQREANREEYRERARAWRAANLKRARASSQRYMHKRRLRENFGLSVEEYGRLVDRQAGRCGICGEAPEGRVLVVDHDHVTGNVRGLLCTQCNVGIGNLGDSADRLRAAIRWLEGGGQGADD